MAEIYQLPENNGNNGNIPFSIPIGLGGYGGGFGNGLGGFNSIADLFGLATMLQLKQAILRRFKPHKTFMLALYQGRP